MVHGGDDGIDGQVLIIWKRRKRKTKMGSRQRYI
jgi:hypothetical protein